MIEFRANITRRMLREEPHKLFVFGDNFERAGFGGQASQMRGEPNAIGIPTKRYPSMKAGAFLSDADLPEWRKHASAAMETIRRTAALGVTIVWPQADIGTGLARLDILAPVIFAEIQKLKKEISQ